MRARKHAGVLVRLCERFQGMPIRGAEVGVFDGNTSQILLEHVPNLHLTMIDSWCEVDRDSSYFQSQDLMAQLPQVVHSRNHEKARERTLFAQERREIMRMTSHEAAIRIDDGSLDFVFLDADHSFAGVSRDIQDWLPKIKRGGMLCGHDYYRRGDINNYGVKAAVDQFISDKKLTLNLERWMVWWCIV